MRVSHAVFFATIFVSASFLHAGQASPTNSPPSGAQTPPPAPSTYLQPSLDTLQQVVGAVKLDKWKKGSIRDESGANINAVQRDLQQTLPGLLKTADAAPSTISKVLPLSRNVDALYDVLVHIVEAARVIAPSDQVNQLQQAMNGLEKARVTLGNHLQDAAAAQEKQISDLRNTVQSQQASLRTAAAAPPVAPCPTPAPAKKKRLVPKAAPKPATTPTNPAPSKP